MPLNFFIATTKYNFRKKPWANETEPKHAYKQVPSVCFAIPRLDTTWAGPIPCHLNQSTRQKSDPRIMRSRKQFILTLI